MTAARPKVLIVAHGLHLGGVERSLIGLLRAMPPEAADIDLLLFDKSGELLPQVPQHVNILPSNSACRALVMPIPGVMLSRHFLIGLARLAAKAVIVGRLALGLPGGFLLARSHRYASRLLPGVVGAYDSAISFLTPHDYVADKVIARNKVGWIHTDYTSVECGVAVAFEAKAWAKMDHIVAVSGDVADTFTRVFPRLQQRVRVIENVLDPKWVRSRSAEPASLWPVRPKGGCLALCSVGRLTHQKGFDIAIEAASLLKSRGLSFSWAIVGYGPDEQTIRKKISDAGLNQEVVLLGALENPYPYMKACDIYVQPSRYEGKAVTIREAQMLGRPVLVSDFPTAKSQIEHGVDGYVVPAGPAGLAAGIELLASDAGLRSRLGGVAAARDYGNLSEVSKVLETISAK